MKKYILLFVLCVTLIPIHAQQMLNIFQKLEGFPVIPTAGGTVSGYYQALPGCNSSERIEPAVNSFFEVQYHVEVNAMVSITDSDHGTLSLTFPANTTPGDITYTGWLGVDFGLMQPAMQVLVVYDVSGGSVAPAEIRLSSSQSGVTYMLLWNGISISQQHTRIGTGTALSFGYVSEGGTYTVVAHDGTQSQTMNGSVTVVASQTVNLSKAKNYVAIYRPTSATNKDDLIYPSVTAVDVTYYDGLGRPEQTVRVAASSQTQKDVVVPIVYDAVGRDDAWQPLHYAADAGDGSYQANALNSQKIYYAGLFGAGDADYAMKESIYESSPLNRLKERFDVGSIFRGIDNKRTVLKYEFNTDADKVRHLALRSGGGVLSSGLTGYYAAGVLCKNSIVDEDGHTLVTFSDQAGLKIMERVENSAAPHFDTYYLYDIFGRLQWVITPEGSKNMLAAIKEHEVEANILKNYAYSYAYDEVGRISAKRIPGAEPVFYVYDWADRVVAVQDGNARRGRNWLLFQYDNLGRLKNQSIVMTPKTQAQMQTDYKNLYSGGTSVLSRSYDQYPANAGLPFSVVAGIADVQDSRVRGMKTYEKLAVLGGTGYIERMFYYDSKGREIQVVERNDEGGVSRFSSKYDFAGRVIARHEACQPSSSTATDILQCEYVYDARGKLLSEKTSLNGGTPGVVLYRYNDLGQLCEKKMDGISETSAYNIQGWLTRKTSPLFDMQLCYFDSEYNTPFYSGNIAEWSWALNGDSRQIYDYQYDVLNRLTYSHYWIGGRLKSSYTERMVYDHNGNIKTLTRYAADARPVDALTGAYTGNQLRNLTESATPLANDVYPCGPVATQTYMYDDNGNQNNDARKGLSFQYNFLNLVSRVVAASGVSADYHYGADGIKRRVVDQAGNGFDYCGNLVYVRKSGSLSLESGAFGSGRLVKKSTGCVPAYFITDHLGSVRAVASGSGQATETSDYYPYGERWPDPSSLLSDNRYRFNGKEKQTAAGLGLLDYGARMYDAQLGRWLSPDPLSEKYYSQTPYGFCGGNPVRNVDPNGMEIDPSSMERWRELTRTVRNAMGNMQQRYDKLLAKGGRASVIGSLGERISELNNVIANFTTLENSQQVYKLEQVGGTEGDVSYDKSDKSIRIRYTGEGNFVHESAHAGQFESGDIAFNTATGDPLLQDITDEVGAYRAQYAFDPFSVSSLSSISSIRSMGDINAAWVRDIRTDQGRFPYVQGGSSNLGQTRLNIHSTRTDFLNAYPNDPFPRNMPSDFNLNMLPNILLKK